MSAFGRLIDTYAETAEQFKVVRAREIFLRKMMSEEDPSEEPAASPVSRGQDKETWEKFLSKIDKCSKYSETIDKENMANQLKKNYNNINFEERITQMQDELLKINQEQRAVDALIAKRASRQRQLLLERDAVDVMDEEATVDSTECSLKAESSRISALLAGLEGLMQFSLHNVSQNGATGDFILECRIAACDAVFVLDASKRLCSMTLPGGDSHINATDVLAEAQQMPAPQDLRFAIFYVSAAQKAPAILKKDVDELRKRCIVQADQSKPSSCFHITFSNGVAIKMSTHACYPNVPNAIHIESISGIGGWSSAELSDAKERTNVNCSCSMLDAVEYLLQILDTK